MKKIKNFKDIERMIFMCYLNPKKKNFREWDAENEGVNSENVDLFYDAFENGGKEMQRILFGILEDFYDMYILPKLNDKKKLTMYHGNREVLALIIEDNTPYIHYQNKIYSSFDGHNPDNSVDFDNDGWYKITGYHKEDLLRMFNEYAK